MQGPLQFAIRKTTLCKINFTERETTPESELFDILYNHLFLIFNFLFSLETMKG